MSYHDLRVLRAPSNPAAGGLPDVLLDQCRRQAAARLTGAARPLDDAMQALLGLAPPDMAFALFGALHDLVARVTAASDRPLHWYPATCRCLSADEEKLRSLLGHAWAGRIACANEAALELCGPAGVTLTPTLHQFAAILDRFAGPMAAAGPQSTPASTLALMANAAA
jgi:hypothetical protein